MLSVAPQPGKVKRARLCDGYRARTFGVCKGRRKAGLCLCVDLAADADVEHCRPWRDWIEALAEPNLVEKEDVSRRKPRSNGESNDNPTIRPSASTVRAPPTMSAPPTLRVRSLFELPFYSANLQFGLAFTDHFADLVAGAISPCPKNYSYDSSTWPSSSGPLPCLQIYSKQSLAPMNRHAPISQSHTTLDSISWRLT